MGLVQNLAIGAIAYNTAKTNQKLDDVRAELARIHELQDEQAGAEQVQQLMRDLLFKMRVTISDEVSNMDPAPALWNLYGHAMLMDREGICAESFAQLADKEYARQAFRVLNTEIASREQQLGAAVSRELRDVARYDVVLGPLDQLARTVRLLELLPGLTIRQRVKQSAALRVMFVIGMVVIAVFAPRLAFMLFIGVIALSLFQASVVKAVVAKNWTQIQAIADRFVDVQKSATKSDALSFIAELENQIVALGEPKAACLNDYVRRAHEMETKYRRAISQYRLTGDVVDASA